MHFDITSFDARFVNQHLEGYHPALLVLLAVNRMILDHGYCQLSNRNVAKLAGVSDSQRENAVEKLRGSGILRIETRSAASGATLPNRMTRVPLQTAHVQAFADAVAVEGLDNEVRIRTRDQGLVPGLDESMIASSVPDVVEGTPRIDPSEQPLRSIPGFDAPDQEFEETNKVREPRQLMSFAD